MAPVMTPAPPGLMSPSSPPGTENPQIDVSVRDSELLQPQRHARGRERITKRRLLPRQPTIPFTTSTYPTAPLPYQPAVRARFRSPPHTKRLRTRSKVVCDRPGTLWASRGGNIRNSLAAKRRERGIGQVGLHVDVR